MAQKTLEQGLEYGHFIVQDRFAQSDETYPMVVGEAVAVLGGNRIVYNWTTNDRGELLRVEVPGILVKERYRTDKHGRTYSLVKPVSDGTALKPALEITVLCDFFIRFGVLPREDTKFNYWPYSSTGLYATNTLGQGQSLSVLG